MTDPLTPDQIVKAALDKIEQDRLDAFSYGAEAWKPDPRIVWAFDLASGPDQTAYVFRDGTQMRFGSMDDLSPRHDPSTIEGEFKVIEP